MNDDVPPSLSDRSQSPPLGGLRALIPGGLAALRRKRRSPWAPRALSLLICLTVFATVALLRRNGGLEFAELKVFDLLARLQPKDHSLDDKIVVVGMTEPDIQRFGFPISDQHMADVLRHVLADDPRAVGIDIFRDQPLPAPPGAGREELVRQLNDPRVVCVTVFEGGSFIGAPARAEINHARQVGFADLPHDRDGRVRRALIYFEDQAGNGYFSMAFELARRFLRAQSRDLRYGPVEGKDNSWFRLGRAEYHSVQPDDGAYVDIDNSATQIMLDFRGGRQWRRQDAKKEIISVGDVLDNKLPAGTFTGKVMVMGMTTSTVKDYVSTSLVTDQHGPAIHAVIAEQLIRAGLTGRGPHAVWPEWREVAWMLAWTLLGGALGFAVRQPVQFIVLLAVAAGGLAAIVYFAFVSRGGLWLPLLPPMIGCVGAAGFVTQFMAHHERAERTVLNELFRRMISGDVADTLWARRDELLDEGHLAAREVRATVLFTDLEGFTTITEAMDKACLMDFLNDYMAVMSDTVGRRPDAFVNKYIGDAVMAVFGPPLERTEAQARLDAQNAVECALEMRAKMAEHRERWERACAEGIRLKRGGESPDPARLSQMDAPRPVIRMRIGIQSGMVVAGSLGSSQRLEYTVIGDTVNTAARLEAYDKTLMDPDLAAHGCRILMGQDTLDLLPPGEYVARPVGSIRLKGKEATVRIHGVVARASDRPEPNAAR